MKEIIYTPELLPCPFCGEVPAKIKQGVFFKESFRIHCENLKCKVRPTISYSNTNKRPVNQVLKTMAKSWNTRAK